jgi:hypothetical protein
MSHGAEHGVTKVVATARQIRSLDFSFLSVAIILVTMAPVALAAVTPAAERSTSSAEQAKTPARPRFVEPLGPTAKAQSVDRNPVVKDPSAGKTSSVGNLPPVVKFDPAVQSMENPVGSTSAPEITMPPASRMEQYRALMVRIETERAKPMGEQDYKAIKAALTEVANDKDKEARNAARYAKHVLKQVADYELVLAIFERVRLQKEQLDKKLAEIEQKRTAKLAEVKDLGRFAVTGEIQPFILYGDGHYRIVDDSGQMLCYALPGGPVRQRDLTGMIGKKVGLVGTIEPHLPTKKAMVRFSEIVPLN